MQSWVTNSPRAAAALRRADVVFEQARDAERTLPLAEKITALRAAKAAREDAYRVAVAEA